MKIINQIKNLFQNSRPQVWPSFANISSGVDKACGPEETIAYFWGPPNHDLVEDACGNVWRRIGDCKYRLEEQHGWLP